MSQLTRSCKWSGRKFTIPPEEQAFYREHDLPLPSLCPDERLRRRLTFRHGGRLHHTTCGLTGKQIVSMYAPTKRFKVYDQTAWWSDSWSAFEYGRDFNFSRSFFAQFRELFDDVPHTSLLNTNCENSYYTNHAKNSKNCYLTFGAVDDEDCQYGYFVISCTDVVDGLSLYDCELCYDGRASFNCYDCISFANCRNCSSSILIEDCLSCEHCIGCFGLRNKRYCIFNKEVGKKSFDAFRASINLSTYGSLDKIRQDYESLKSASPHLFAHIYNSENCSGEMIFDSKNCHHAFDVKNSEDCRYIAFSPNSVHSLDCTFTALAGVQFSYECVSTLSSDATFSMLAWGCNEVDYCFECHNSRNLFGCVGLKNAQFCILNKQFSESEYHELRGKIVTHLKHTSEWGEFFPLSLSPFAYNDSIAIHYAPLTKNEATALGFDWRDEPVAPAAKDSKYDAPKRLEDVTDQILNEVLTCEATKKRYKLTPGELKFYRKMGIPVPRLCPEERHRRRFADHHSYKLFSRKCSKSGVELLSVYPENKVTKVLSEEEFLKLV